MVYETPETDSFKIKFSNLCPWQHWPSLSPPANWWQGGWSLLHSRGWPLVGPLRRQKCQFQGLWEGMCPSYSSLQRAAFISVITAKVERGWAAGGKKEKWRETFDSKSETTRGFGCPCCWLWSVLKGSASSLSAHLSCITDLAMGHTPEPLTWLSRLEPLVSWMFFSLLSCNWMHTHILYVCTY